MEYKLDLKGNALDSFQEALSKFELGQKGEMRAYKFAILHISHFMELILKLYIQSVDKNLVFSKCFSVVKKRSKATSTSLLDAYKSLSLEGFCFDKTIEGDDAPHTITLDQALAFAKCEKCSVTGVSFIDEEFSCDIEWLKGLRNCIEHYEFGLTTKEVRLSIGCIVRGAAEFLDIFSLFDLAAEAGEKNYHVFQVLADEYEQRLLEAKLEVEDKEKAAFKGVRPKYHSLIDWHVYLCPECGHRTLIPNEESCTGYRCAFCNNEESDEIEAPCDCCGAMEAMGDMTTFPLDDGEVELRCQFCSGEYLANRWD